MAEALFSSALADVAAVSSSLQVEQVLDQILEQVSYVVPSDTRNIMLIEGMVLASSDGAGMRPSASRMKTSRRCVQPSRSTARFGPW